MGLSHSEGDVVTDGLVWCIDARNPKTFTTGTTAKNLNAGKFTDTLVGNYSYNNGKLILDGNNTWLDVNYNGSYESEWYNQSYTIGGFARQTDTLTNDTWLFDLDYVGYRIWGGNNVPFMVRGPAASWNVASAYTLNDGNWHYVVGTMIDNGSANNVNVYVDGNKIATYSWGLKNIGFAGGANYYTRIGAHHHSGNERAFEISYMHYHGIVFTEEQVKQNWEILRRRYGI